MSEFGLDNRYWKYGCPALMQDGRFITSYVPQRLINLSIKEMNNIESAQDYRHFLQKNGDAILNKQRAILHKVYTCGVSGKCVSLDGNANCTNLCGCN